MRQPRAFVRAMLLTLALITAAPDALAEPRGGRVIEVQGRRGARAARPENTLAAFEYALEVGVDVLELDLSVSRDDQLIVVHDQFVNPESCRGPKGEKLTAPGPAIRSLSVAELQTYDCGSLPHPRFPSQKRVPAAKMPTLEEVFALVHTSKHPAAKRVRFNIETKSVPARPELSPSPERFAELVLRAIEKGGFLQRANLQSFDHRTLVAAKKLNSKLPVAALTSDNRVNYVAIAKAIGAEIISPDKDWITKEDVDQLHAAGVRVIPWTANDAGDWRRLIDMQVDGIITDDPAALLHYLRAAGLR